MNNNKFKHYAVMLFILTTFSFTACKKEEDFSAKKYYENINSSLPVNTGNSLTKKWITSQTNVLRTSASNPYVSFEFTPYGKYIVIDDQDNAFYGDYTYDVAQQTIKLHSLGFITIVNLSDSQFKFIFEEYTYNISYEITSTPNNVMDLVNDKTYQLARSWKLISQTKNGVPTSSLFLSDAEVTITPYGTHFIQLYGLFGDEIYPQVWKWSDDLQQKICVGSTTPSCSRPLNIYLSKDNKLNVIYESNSGNGTISEIYEAL